MVTPSETIQVTEELKFSYFNQDTDFSSLNFEFEKHSLDELLQWSLSVYGDRLAQVTSFGPTGMVILDHLARLSPGIRIVTLDPHFLFDETYTLMEEVQRRYPITLDVRKPSISPQTQVETYGEKLWATDPDRCCYLRKVVPLQQVLQDLDAWLTGLRRDQASTRANLPLIGWDNKYDLVKINPLADWTREQVWKYIVEHKVPYNSLHDQGYASIGCVHCTHPTTQPDDERSGRWKGRQKIECGIHASDG